MKCRGCGKTIKGLVLSQNDGLCEGAGRGVSCWSRCQLWGFSQNIPVWKSAPAESADIWEAMQLSPVLIDQWIELGCPAPAGVVLPAFLKF